MAHSADTVLVTGASGFIATHVVQQLQQQGYRVRGTVRSLTNEAKTKPLYNLCPDAQYKLDLVEADLQKSETWPEAVRGCTYILHVASPVPKRNPSNEDDVIKPAVDGTLNVLKAAKDAGTVKRVVITSSVAAVCGMLGNPGHDPNIPYTENDWTERATLAYVKSKTLAEKAAWDFVQNLPAENRFELAVVHPVLVFGPILCCSSDMASLDILRLTLQGKMLMVPRINLPVVDVRDVATAHIRAMTVAGAAGKRLILSSHNVWMKDMSLVIQKEFQPQGYRVPVRDLPNIVVRIAGWFSKTGRETAAALERVTLFDNTRMHEILNVIPRDLNETLIDTCYSLIEHGIVKKTNTYRGKDRK